MFYDPYQCDIIVDPKEPQSYLIYMFTVMKYSANRPVYTHHYSLSVYPFTKYIRINQGVLEKK
jgi:hypothetical protein